MDTPKQNIRLNPAKAEVWANKYWNAAHTKKTYIPMLGVEQVGEGVRQKTAALNIAQGVKDKRVEEYQNWLVNLLSGTPIEEGELVVPDDILPSLEPVEGEITVHLPNLGAEFGYGKEEDPNAH